MPIYTTKKVNELLNNYSMSSMYLCYQMFKDSFENNISHEDFLSQFMYYTDNINKFVNVNNDDFLKFQLVWNKREVLNK